MKKMTHKSIVLEISKIISQGKRIYMLHQIIKHALKRIKHYQVSTNQTSLGAKIIKNIRGQVV